MSEGFLSAEKKIEAKSPIIIISNFERETTRSQPKTILAVFFLYFRREVPRPDFANLMWLVLPPCLSSLCRSPMFGLFCKFQKEFQARELV